MYKRQVLYCDGAAKANPVGPCGAGGILYSSSSFADAGDHPPQLGGAITSYKQYLGSASNNEAEYHALLLGLQTALAHGVTHLLVRLDSELIVKQVRLCVSEACLAQRSEAAAWQSR